MALYEGPAGDEGKTNKMPSTTAVLNGEPEMEKRTPSSMAVPEVTYQEFGILTNPTKG